MSETATSERLPHPCPSLDRRGDRQTMKSTLAFTLIALQILTFAAVVYFELETRRSTKASIDRLEQVRDNLAGSVTRQSEIVLRLKGLIENLDRQSDHAAAQAYIGGDQVSETPNTGTAQ